MYSERRHLAGLRLGAPFPLCAIISSTELIFGQGSSYPALLLPGALARWAGVLPRQRALPLCVPWQTSAVVPSRCARRAAELGTLPIYRARLTVTLLFCLWPFAQRRSKLSPWRNKQIPPRCRRSTRSPSGTSRRCSRSQPRTKPPSMAGFPSFPQRDSTRGSGCVHSHSPLFHNQYLLTPRLPFPPSSLSQHHPSAAALPPPRAPSDHARNAPHAVCARDGSIADQQPVCVEATLAIAAPPANCNWGAPPSISCPRSTHGQDDSPGVPTPVRNTSVKQCSKTLCGAHLDPSFSGPLAMCVCARARAFAESCVKNRGCVHP